MTHTVFYCPVFVQETTHDLMKTSLEQIHRDISTPRDTESTSSPGPRTREYGLVIDGKTLAFALKPSLQKMFLLLAGKCNSVICCRSSPIQKVFSLLISTGFLGSRNPTKKVYRSRGCLIIDVTVWCHGWLVCWSASQRL